MSLSTIITLCRAHIFVGELHIYTDFYFKCVSQISYYRYTLTTEIHLFQVHESKGFLLFLVIGGGTKTWEPFIAKRNS